MAEDLDKMHEIAQEQLAGNKEPSPSEGAIESESFAYSAKAQLDIEQTQAGVGRVALAASQVRELIEESGFATDPLAPKSSVSSAASDDAVLVDDEAIRGQQAPLESVFLDEAFENEPASAAAAPPMPVVDGGYSDWHDQHARMPLPQESAAYRGAAPMGGSAGAEEDYWRGFVPVQPTAQMPAVAPSGAPAPQHGASEYLQPAAQGYQPSAIQGYAQPGPQPVAQPYAQMQPQAYQQASPASYGQPIGVVTQTGEQPFAQAPQQAPQPYGQQTPQPYGQQTPQPYPQPYAPPADAPYVAQSAPGSAMQQRAIQSGSQPYAQAPAQPGAQQDQPYGGAQVPPQQVYTPQMQQPAGYVPAQDLTMQPQPSTPAYEKSNKSTLAIVIAIVVAVLGIIAAVIIGRILSANASEGDNPMIEQFSSIQEQLDSSAGSGGGAGNHGSGSSESQGPGNGEGYGPGSSEGPGAWGGGAPDFGDNLEDFSDNNGGWYQDGDGHIYGGGIDADDGELHSGWNDSVGYTYKEEEFSRNATEVVDAYGMTLACDFNVDYPQLEGDIPNLDAINKAIRDKAMQTVTGAYENPDQTTKDAVQSFAGSSEAGASESIPSGADAILTSDVDYAITYNTDEFISIAFSDEYALGSSAGSFIALRTINVNLKTGDFYEIGDVLNVTDDIAGGFVDNLTNYDRGTSLRLVGRDGFVSALEGKGDNANRVATTFFIDGNGKVNLGATFSFGGDTGRFRGWWDYTITDDQLAAAKKESTLWDVVVTEKATGSQQAEPQKEDSAAEGASAQQDGQAQSQEGQPADSVEAAAS